MKTVKKILLINLQFALIAFLVAPLQAAQQADVPISLPLAKLMTQNQPIKLIHASSSFTLFVPVSSRVRVNSALLHLQLTNSISLIKDRSQLTIRLNDRLVAQVPLSPLRPESSADIRLPAKLLEPGYNKLVFSVAQHYTLECEDPTAPELWTQIDTTTSTLTLGTDLLPLTPRLSDLAQLFDPKLWGDKNLMIVTASSGALRDDQLQWGALVGQGAALRFKYAPLNVEHLVASRVSSPATSSDAIFPNLDQERLKLADSALVGTKAELAAYLSKRVLDKISGSFLGVYPLDADPRRLMVVVSGTNAVEVTRAAKVFTFLNFAYPDAPQMLVSDFGYPVLADYAGHNALSEDSVYKFSQLDFATTTVKGSEPHNMEITFSIPPDIFTHEDSQVELNLHLAYGAAMRNDSVLNILLNEQFQAAIPLTEPRGEIFEHYKIIIPLRSFQPGQNRIMFASRLMPLNTGKCTQVGLENLILTLFGDSTLHMPQADHFVAMPNLRLFSRTGFPYTVKADGTELQVDVVSKDSKTVAAAWTLLAKLAQRNWLPLYQVEMSFAAQKSDKNLVVVGTLDKLPSKLLEGAPLQFGNPSKVPYPVGVVYPSAQYRKSWLDWFGLRGWNAIGVDSESGTSNTAFVIQVSDPPDRIMAMQYQSPFARAKTVTVFVAANADILEHGMMELVKPEIWDGLQGDLASWRKGDANLSWQKAGSDYTIGKVNFSSRLEFYFSKYPWLWFVTLVVLVLILAALTSRMLMRFRQKREP